MRANLLLIPALAWLLGGPLAAAEIVLLPGEPLTREKATDLLSEALAAQGGEGEQAAVEIHTPALPLPNRAATPMRIAVTDLRLEPVTGRFTARLLARLDSGKAALIPSSGQIRKVVQVMVPVRAIARGETIAAEDLTAQAVPITQLRDDSLQDAEQLVGFSAKRSLLPGRILRAGDVAAPLLVERGEPVVMVYRQGSLELTGSGIALEPGRLGQTVRMENVESGQVRVGRVVGRRRIEIGTGETMP